MNNHRKPIRSCLKGFFRERSVVKGQRVRIHRAVKLLWVHLGREPEAGDMNHDRLTALANWMQAKGRAGTYVNETLAALARLARYLADEGLIASIGERPVVPNTKRPPRETHELKPPKAMQKPVLPTRRPLPKDKPATCLDLYERWYEPRVLIQASEHYKDRFRQVLRKFGEFLGHVAAPDDLADDAMIDYMAWLVECGREAATANTHRKQLVALANFAARKKLIAEFPDVPKFQELRRAATSWTVDEIGRILKSCWYEVGMIGEVQAGDWWQALVLTIYDTGGRRGAVLRTPYGCLDMPRGVLTLPAEVQKTRQDERFALGDDTQAALRRIAGKRALLFDWNHDTGTLFNHYRRILKRARLPHTRRDMFHKLRRTSATLAELTSGEGAGQRHMGHSDPAVTERYIDRSVLPARRIADRLPRPEGFLGRDTATAT